MNRLLIIALAVLLHGCAVTLHGNQTVSGGSTSTTTGSSVRASTQAGNARVAASFGTPPPANAAGGQVSFSKGASAVVVVALAIAGATEAVSSWFGPRAPAGGAERREPLAPGGISHTCSCYGWRPDLLTPAPEPQ
jgi:hypothetical protein